MKKVFNILRKLEMALDTVTLDNIGYSDVIGNWSESSEQLIWQYKSENTEYEELDDDEIIETEDYKNWLKYEVEYKFDEIKGLLQDKINGGKVDVWRKMSVADDWYEKLINSGKHLGIYWSFDSNSAEAHWGHNQNTPVEVLIKSSVNEEYVNWVDTIMLNMNPQLGEEEKEIRLFKNTSIKIEQLFINNEEIDISKIKNKEFKA